MWILILTLYNYDVYKGTSMTSSIATAEFSSEAKCMAAGSAWLKRNTDFDKTQALCVKK